MGEAGPLFEEFWRAYPRKVAKVKCAQIWTRNRLDDVAPRVMAGLAWQVRQVFDPARPEYTPHPSTWLNQGRWDDEPVRRASGDGGGDFPRSDLPEL